MKHQAVCGCSFVMFLTYGALAVPVHQQEVTPAPDGPFHVDHAQILDSKGHSFLMRGTQLSDFHPQTAARDNRAGRDFGPHSATSLTAVRLRFNMNAVRLPLDVREAGAPGYFAELAKVVRRANQLELLVILAAREPGATLPSPLTTEFWTRCATAFKDYPNVVFDAFSDPSPAAVPAGVDPHSAAGWEIWRSAMAPVVHAIRAAGAPQPIVLMSWNDDRMFEGAGDRPLREDADIIYEVSPRYVTTTTDAQREERFGFLARRAPVTANGWDLELDNPTACAAIPSDPAAASDMVRANLDDLDASRISWTMSVFKPGKLIKDLSLHDATSLENGWTCGPQKFPAPGMGRVVEGHLRATEERSIFVVSAAGGVDLPRGGFANGYGPVMAERDAQAHGPRLPLSLAGITVEVADSAGTTRPAGIFWVSAGWGQVNFVVPEESAPGRAVMTLVRHDGSRLSTNITIADTAPGFRTGLSCRGAAVGTAIQAFAGGHSATTPISVCTSDDCRALDVPMTAGTTTKVRLRASGFRHAASASDIQVTVGGQRVKVLSYGPGDDPGMDQLTVAIPASLRGLGETDVVASVRGRVSNVVRIRIGG
jgi:uncharacterized protein (TIGR03437 family)